MKKTTIQIHAKKNSMKKTIIPSYKEKNTMKKSMTRFFALGAAALLTIATLTMTACAADESDKERLQQAGKNGELASLTLTHHRIGLLNYWFLPTWIDYTHGYTTAEQLTAIKEYAGDTLMPVATTCLSNDVTTFLPAKEGNYYRDLSESNAYYHMTLSYESCFLESCIEIDPVTGADDLALSPDERFVDPTLCRLPQNVTEIAISDFQADIFMEFGLKDFDGTEWEITTPDDLIGKTLVSPSLPVDVTGDDSKKDETPQEPVFESSPLTIVGVYSTVQDKSEFDKYKSLPASAEYEVAPDGSVYDENETLGVNLATCAFVCKRFSVSHQFSAQFLETLHATEEAENPGYYLNGLPHNFISTVFFRPGAEQDKNNRLLDDLTYDEFGLYFLIDHYSVSVRRWS